VKFLFIGWYQSIFIGLKREKKITCGILKGVLHCAMLQPHFEDACKLSIQT